MDKNVNIDDVENFFEEYDHAGSIGWLQEIINGEYDLGLLRKAINEHAKGNKDKCQKYVDQIFKK